MYFVGDGRGDYIQETTYKYVGNGAGQFDMAGGPRRRSCLVHCAVASFGFFVAVVLMLVILACLPDSLKSLFEDDSGKGGDGTHNCFAGYATWQDTWSQDKKVWCCNHMQVACEPQAGAQRSAAAAANAAPATGTGASVAPAQPAAPASSAVPATMAPAQAANLPRDFTCNAADAPSWEQEKRAYCCTHFSVGCTSAVAVATTVQPTTSSTKFNCQVSLQNWQREWSANKKEWCCTHEQTGCLSDRAELLAEVEAATAPVG